HSRLEDVECRGDFAEVNLAVGEDGAAALLAFAVAVLPELLAGLGVEAKEGAGFIGDVDLAVVNDRGRVAGHEAFLFPDELGASLVDGAGVETDEAALDIGTGAFLAVADVDVVAGDNRRSIEGTQADREAPHRFAGADLDGIDAAIGSPGNQ